MTKYRRKVLNGLMISYLDEVFRKVCQDFGADPVECNGEDDHVHLLIEYPPQRLDRVRTPREPPW